MIDTLIRNTICSNHHHLNSVESEGNKVEVVLDTALVHTAAGQKGVAVHHNVDVQHKEVAAPRRAAALHKVVVPHTGAVLRRKAVAGTVAVRVDKAVARKGEHRIAAELGARTVEHTVLVAEARCGVDTPFLSLFPVLLGVTN